MRTPGVPGQPYWGLLVLTGQFVPNICLVILGVCVGLCAASADIYIAVLFAPGHFVVQSADGLADFDVAKISPELLKIIPSWIVVVADKVKACPPSFCASGFDFAPRPIDWRVAVQHTKSCVSMHDIFFSDFYLSLMVKAPARCCFAAGQLHRRNNRLAPAVAKAH